MTFITPLESKIRPHMRADTMVGIAHGIRIAARTKPLPRKARAMISAIATPRMVSSPTQTTVKKVTFQKELTNRSIDPQTPETVWGWLKMSVKLASPTKDSPSGIRPVTGSTVVALRKTDSRSESRIGIPTTKRMTSMVGEIRTAASVP